MQIREFMTNDHRMCDEQFSGVEEAVNNGDFDTAKKLFCEFKEHTLKHFRQEEELLFIEFTNATGMVGGPVEVMIYEHNQIRSLIDQLDMAIQNSDSDSFFGASETMMILLQQHNMKEEQMLYNMIQNSLSARNDELVSQLKSM